jgi:hypothetical protein
VHAGDNLRTAWCLALDHDLTRPHTEHACLDGEMEARTGDVDSDADLELVEMKRQRNALTAICRLPSEILIAVFERVQREDECKWTRVMLVCHHFYHIAVSAPMLWTWIDCVRRPQAAIDICARRSAPALLHIITDTADHTDLWTRSESAHLLNMDAMDLLDVSAPHLKTLTIDSRSDTMILITPLSLLLVSISLVHLKLTGTSIILEGAPFMPTLRRLDLQNITTDYSFKDLASFLTQTPEVETLITENLYLLDDGGILDATMLFPVPARAVLPRLQHLYVEDTPAEAGAMMRFLPAPRLAFGILVRHSLYSWHGIGQNEQYVYSAWLQSWRARAQADQLPEATITFDHSLGPRTVGWISFGCVKTAQDFRQQPEAACFCVFQCVLLGVHTMLDYVVTIRLCETDTELQGVAHEDLDGVYGARFLPNVSTLVLEDFVTVYVGYEVERMDSIRAWIASRQGKIKSVRLIDCAADFEATANRWREEGVAPEVYWSSI